MFCAGSYQVPRIVGYKQDDRVQRGLDAEVLINDGDERIACPPKFPLMNRKLAIYQRIHSAGLHGILRGADGGLALWIQ